jgi:hypothetical protein
MTDEPPKTGALTEADGDRALADLKRQIEAARAHVRAYRATVEAIRGSARASGDEDPPPKAP